MAARRMDNFADERSGRRSSVDSSSSDGNPRPRASTTDQALYAEREKRTARKLLGALHTDRQFLRDLAIDESARGDSTLRDVVEDGITFLDNRQDFWRQQKPLYARSFEARRARDGRTHRGLSLIHI